MLEFKNVELSDRQWASELMRNAGFRGSEYTFSNLFNWSTNQNTCICRFENFLLARSGHTSHHYMYPMGSGDITNAMLAITEQCRNEGTPLLLYGVNEQAKQNLENCFPGRFEFKEVRNSFDYIYSREKLATLAGKKYHGKRNHIARFKDLCPNWSYERIDENNIEDARHMSIEWYKENSIHESHSLQREAYAVKSAFEHYFELGLVGGLLRSDGRVIAITFGSQATDDTFVVHVEKAFAAIQGCYPMINQQFVQNELSQYTYVNREEDLGDEGLRKSKESYYPEFMYVRYLVSEKVE